VHEMAIREWRRTATRHNEKPLTQSAHFVTLVPTGEALKPVKKHLNGFYSGVVDIGNSRPRPSQASKF
jgi:hypothetical protein